VLKSSTAMKKFVAEFVGTFALVFKGTGAIVINDVSAGRITHVGIALTFGLIVFVVVRTTRKTVAEGSIPYLDNGGRLFNILLTPA
jgi:glycerol uptake facilitator-like aquaporin